MGSIICGVDGTKSAARAVNVARALGAQLGLQLVFVRVVALGTAEEETAAIAEQLEELSASDDWLIEVGHPVDRLVAAAADDQVRLLVVGSHGPRSSLLGSVSAELSRRASCPVVVVPPGAQVRKMPSDRDADSAGGIVRLGLGANGGVDSAGGILRFDLGGGGQKSSKLGRC
jgi:nucleotide-binding universal stress UspA family protein